MEMRQPEWVTYIPQFSVSFNMITIIGNSVPPWQFLLGQAHWFSVIWKLMCFSLVHKTDKVCSVPIKNARPVLRSETDKLPRGLTNFWGFFCHFKFNSWRLRQHCRHFAADIFKWILLNENVWILLQHQWVNLVLATLCCVLHLVWWFVKKSIHAPVNCLLFK